jgi:sporulation protein YlmC with PRC-barrel domain
MKRTLQVMIRVSAVSVLALTVNAQIPVKSEADKTEVQNPQSVSPPRGRITGVARSTDIIGMTIKSREGETLGKVEDIAVDIESGRIVQIILSYDKSYKAVPPGVVRHEGANKFLLLDADKEKIAAAPHIAVTNWGAIHDHEHLSQVYRSFGQAKVFDFIQTQGDGKHAMIPVTRLSHIQKASKLIGVTVKNLQAETLGEVDNIILDLSSGRVLAVIVSSGGFLGIGEELSAIPPTSLQFTKDWETLQLDTSKDRLKEAPHFKASEWPDFTKPSVSAGVYKAYKVDPYFDTAPDNTAVNVRDRSEKSLTPFDQSNDAADLDLITQIRKEIIAKKEMSVNAHNVKIIATKGRVTLRGPVDSAEEKRIISEIADRIARPENVENLLEVKSIPPSN